MAGVVYLLTCQFGSFYTGKTKLQFRKRARRHVISMMTANPELPLERHVGHYHARICTNFQFLILHCIHPNTRRLEQTSAAGSPLDHGA